MSKKTIKKETRSRKKTRARPPRRRDMAAALLWDFATSIERFEDHPSQRNVQLAALHAATYTQLRCLLMLLPRIAAKPKTRQWAFDVLEHAAAIAPMIFFNGLREDGIRFPPELPQSLCDVFTSAQHGLIENALAMLAYEYEAADSSESPQGPTGIAASEPTP